MTLQCVQNVTCPNCHVSDCDTSQSDTCKDGTGIASCGRPQLGASLVCAISTSPCNVIYVYNFVCNVLILCMLLCIDIMRLVYDNIMRLGGFR